MERTDSGLLQGTLDLLILKSLRSERRHGYAVIRWLREVSHDELLIEDGALYPALHRLEARGLIEAEWGTSENNRRAKYYQLSSQGVKRLKMEAEHWTRHVRIVQRVLEAA